MQLEFIGAIIRGYYKFQVVFIRPKCNRSNSFSNTKKKPTKRYGTDINRNTQISFPFFFKYKFLEDITFYYQLIAWCINSFFILITNKYSNEIYLFVFRLFKWKPFCDISYTLWISYKISCITAQYRYDMNKCSPISLYRLTKTPLVYCIYATGNSLYKNLRTFPSILYGLVE